MDNNKRFEKIYDDEKLLASEGAAIYLDKETGVNYLLVKSGYGAGLTPLLNSDGNVVVTKKD